MSFAIRSSFQTLHVYALEEHGQEDLLYSLDSADKQQLLDMPPSQWNIVAIPYEYRNSVVILEYYSSYETYYSYQPTIYIGQEADLLSTIVAKTFPDQILSWITIVFSIATFIVCFITSKKSFSYMKYLSVFLFMYGMWSWGECKSYFFNYAPLHIQTNITLYIVMFMPVPLMMYLKKNPKCFYINKQITNTFIHTYFVITIFEILIGSLLYLLDLYDLIEFIVVPLFFLIIAILMLLFFEVKSSIEKYIRCGKFNAAPFVILLISGALELISFFRGDFFCTGVYSRIGVLVFGMNIYVEEILENRQEQRQFDILEDELLKVNIHMMASKMKPHFIHNTLLAIQELCYSDPKQAYDAIGLFSRYLRSNIDGSYRDELISFRQELEHIKIYIEIQEMCYEDAIDFHTELGIADFTIPPFTIQPLVENAIAHGILKSRKKGKVSLRTWLEGDVVYIEVTDNGVGFDTSIRTIDQFNSTDAVSFRIKKQLQGNIIIKSELSKGTVVLVSLPYKQLEEVLK